MAKATGVGGVFLKAKDAKAVPAWYAGNLASRAPMMDRWCSK